MPAVKVFNIFGGQKSSEKHPAAPSAHNKAMQKLYRTFSVGSENSSELKGGKVTAIAACLEKRIVSEPLVKNCSDNVQKNSPIIEISSHIATGKLAVSKSQRVYENVNIPIINTGVKNKLREETKGYSSIYENVTFLDKQKNDKIDSDSNESKLNKALESFDKILSEFSSSTSLSADVNYSSTFIVPKLQKSKTCSIIESRCILKKSNSDPESDNKLRNKVTRNKSIDKTTSLWNLDDMKSKELLSPLMPFPSIQNEKNNSDKYATYKISSKNTSRPNCIKTEDLKKLDVKTRILKKTLSNPPSTPVPVITKTKPVPKKIEKKISDPKKIKPKVVIEKTRTSTECKEMPKSQMQKAKSVWEIGNETVITTNLERTKSTTSIAGSPSKIPVIRSQMSQNKFSSTRALFSPTPVDLNNVDQARECAQKKKSTASRKTSEKFEPKQIKQKSQLSLKTDSKRQCDKTKREILDKKQTSSPKLSIRNYSDEINAVRAKLQEKKINNKRDLVVAMPEAKRSGNEPEEIDSTLSPVKYLVKKLEYKTALESKSEPTQFLNCKVIPAIHKEVCVANTTFHNHLSTLVGRQVKYIEPRDDTKICTQIEKMDLHKNIMEKISDTHSDCSDDSGHVSNDAGNDNDAVFDNVHDLNSGVDEVDCKLFKGPKQYGIELPEHAKSVCPVRPARRGGRGNEVVSGTQATDVPKVDEQIMFRGGVVGGLDARRDAALARVLVRLQARARGLLARRRAQRLRTQHTAARCVQRNVRAFLAVRDWPWWRLLVRVTPLLAVHRTEHRLKQAQEELETLRAKLEKVEGERTHYKNETEKLETKVRLFNKIS
ncbi:unnamed protein product [Parnassius apollo]|uniref:(apollo) hypothetical protein n=1 Tax=Parnassius apollo TaxID=110799 RepID=A0A8S3Y138_PARAO|nr:unnamed protein product [Parnassius apollo]